MPIPEGDNVPRYVIERQIGIIATENGPAPYVRVTGNDPGLIELFTAKNVAEGNVVQGPVIPNPPNAFKRKTGR